VTASTVPPLPADLAAGLKRLKLAAMRTLAPELLVTATTQRWKPEELLRTLVEAEIASRDASNTRTRLRTASFPVIKTLEDFDVSASSVPPATFDYLASLEWLRAAENLCLLGPAGTGKSHLLVALGVAAVHTGDTRPLLHRRRARRDALPRMADNSVGRVIDTLLRNDLIIVDELGFAPLDDTGAQLLFRFVAAAYERRALAVGSHHPVRGLGSLPARAHHRRQPARPATAPLPHRHHRRRELPHARSPQPRKEPPPHHLNTTRGGDFQLATSGDHELAVDSQRPASSDT
jgi:DNA replication protein DnaC